MADAGQGDALKLAPVMSRAGGMVGRYWPILLFITLVFDFLPALGLDYAARRFPGHQYWWVFQIGVCLAIMLAYAMRAGAVAALVLADQRGEPGASAAALRKAVSRIPQLMLVALILIGPSLAARFWPLISNHAVRTDLALASGVAGWIMIILGVFFAPLAAVTADDRRSRGTTLGAALDLSRGRRWKIFGIHLLWLLPCGVLLTVLSILAAGPAGGVNIPMLAKIFLRGLTSVILGVIDASIYLSLIAGKEGDASARVSEVFA